MTRIRGFEKVSYEQWQEACRHKAFSWEAATYRALRLPQRASAGSAGYDFFAPYDLSIASGEMHIVPTGIKAYMQAGEWLALLVRSSHGFKYNLRLKNQVGVIDKDYYDNEKNEGHIFIALHNEGDKTIKIAQGEAFTQGIFLPFLLADDDVPIQELRLGGLGSTGQQV